MRMTMTTTMNLSRPLLNSQAPFFKIGAKLKEEPVVKPATSSITTTTTTTTQQQQQEQLPVLEDPNAMYAYGADPNAYYQYYYQQEQTTDDSSTKETLGNDVLSQLGGKRRGEHAGVNIIDVNQTDILPTEEWRRQAEAQQPKFAATTSSATFEVNSLKKKKNNIMALAAQAKTMEHALEERYAQERIAKAQARNRYGF
ncbi:proline-rich protein [Chlamydoabsidia padenii]|nr:proline-rich protein [Chlamydoabsidia padenii]